LCEFIMTLLKGRSFLMFSAQLKNQDAEGQGKGQSVCQN
jgi:hypothetical protein